MGNNNNEVTEYANDNEDTKKADKVDHDEDNGEAEKVGTDNQAEKECAEEDGDLSNPNPEPVPDEDPSKSIKSENLMKEDLEVIRR